MAPTDRSDRSDRFDLVVFGATSFVGQIVCRRLVERIGTDGAVTWAIAGRDPAKLDAVAADSGADVERLVVDAGSDDDMASLAAAARIVASTVGPYALHGTRLVAAVAAAGTDYCDLTGEPQWMRAMIDAHADAAIASGARLVHACGFDSIPSDLGTWFLQQQAIERFGEPCVRVGLRVASMRGGASGGTVASGLNVVAEARRDPELRRILADPYALAPAELRHGPRQPDVDGPRHDELTGEWVAPFIMAATNSRVVHRTHALLGRPWGGFRYDEAIATGGGPVGAARAAAIAAATLGFAGLAALSPTRRLLAQVLPSPGEGPSPAAQEAGGFDIRLHGRTAGGAQIVAAVTGDRDPGYGSTARMLTESALAFRDVDRATVPGGFWTPSTMFGDLLIERLRTHAGLTFDVIAA